MAAPADEDIGKQDFFRWLRHRIVEWIGEWTEYVLVNRPCGSIFSEHMSGEAQSGQPRSATGRNLRQCSIAAFAGYGLR